MSGAPLSVATPPRPLYVSEFAMSLGEVREQITSVQMRVGDDVIVSDRRNDMLMVLGEVLNNIVIHADAGRTEGRITLTIHQSENLILVETRDKGKPLPPDVLRQGNAPKIDCPVPDLPEGGFGWFIIHSVVDDIVYERSNGENLLTFSFAVG